MPAHIQRDNKGGVVLILVLWVVVILIAMVGEFSFSMRTELNMTRNFKEENEAYQAAIAGIEIAKYEILSVKPPYYVYTDQEGKLVFGDESSESPDRSGTMGNGFFSYTLTDENGKLNINEANRQQIMSVIRSSGVDVSDADIIVDSILDWRDKNDLHMLNGAEEDYYQSLDRPYSCKDGPFDIIEELLLVRGVAPEIFFGTAADEGTDGDENTEYGGLVEYLSTWSSNRVNLNTAPREVLEAMFDPAQADNIIRQREAGPILRPISGGILTSSVFTVLSTGTNADGTITRTIKTTLRKSRNKLEVIYWNDNVIGKPV